MRTRFLLATACLLTVLVGTPRAECPDGRWNVGEGLLLPTEVPGLDNDVIAFADGTVQIASGCPPTEYYVRELRQGGLLVKARWRQCGDVARRVRVRMRIAPECDALRGIVKTRHPLSRRRFTATPAGSCVPGDPMCPPCRVNGDCADAEYCAKDTDDCRGEGECVARPEVCTEEFQPVCGCDGITYDNACFAAAAGVNISKEGPCESRCGTIAGIVCGDGEFCEFPPGKCNVTDLAGMCLPIPDACPTVFDPVCGCDGVTYDNDCERQAAQAQKAKDGPCRCPQILCAPGTLPVDTDGDGCDDACHAPCDDPCDCYRNPFLDFEDGCPLLCPNCGNFWTCEEGFCVEQCGFIPPELQECRLCRSNGECVDGSYCAKEPGSCDGLGSCEPRPDACPDVYDPVCGCDGETYGNRCDAAAAGVSIAHEGECKTVCGTIVGIPCGDREFCEFPPGTCNVADLPGMCVEIPQGCPEIYAPVCSCDGVTYSNDCERQAARAQKAQDGPCECPQIPCAPGTLPVDREVATTPAPR